MKIKTSIKKLCKNCKVIRRNKKLINVCKFKNHKHKQK